MLQTFTLVFIAAVAIHSLIEFWLSARHKNHITSHRDTVPARFSAHVSLAAHQKAANYTLSKLSFEKWSGLYSLMLLMAWTLGGGLQWLDSATQALALGSLLNGLTFIIGFSMISSLLELPFSWYQTFDLEERFGFNKSTTRIWIMDILKNTLVMLILGAPLLALILWFMQSSGNLWWLWAWLSWTTFMLLMMWLYPTVIAPLFNKFKPLKDDALKARIENLLKRCGFESQGLFVMDGSRRSAHGNAYFTGFGKSKRIVFFDTLLKQLNANETEAVLAHELGHFKHGHVRKRLLLMICTTFVGFATLGWLSGQTWFYQGLGVEHASHHALLVLFMLVLPHFLFWLSPLSSLLSRKHEFEADTYASQQSNADDLISALVKMYEDNASTLTPDPLFSAWHDSHPPAAIRIAHLEQTGSPDR